MSRWQQTLAWHLLWMPEAFVVAQDVLLHTCSTHATRTWHLCLQVCEDVLKVVQGAQLVLAVLKQSRSDLEQRKVTLVRHHGVHDPVSVCQQTGRDRQHDSLAQCYMCMCAQHPADAAERAYVSATHRQESGTGLQHLEVHVKTQQRFEVRNYVMCHGYHTSVSANRL